MTIENLIPNRILWSQGAEDFAYSCVDIVRELGGQDKEWDCDMITMRNDPERRVVRLIPSVRSYVGGGYVQVPGRAISDNIDVRLKALRQKEKLDLIMSGILHSHAGIGSFFSSIDFKDFEKEGPKIAENNPLFEGWMPFKLFEQTPTTQLLDGCLVTFSDSKFDPRLIEHLPRDQAAAEVLGRNSVRIEGGVDMAAVCRGLIELVKREYQEYVRVGIAQAIVVDASKTNPFGIFGYHINKPLSNREGCWRTTERVPVETVPVKKDMRFNKKKLREYLRESLRIDERMPKQCSIQRFAPIPSPVQHGVTRFSPDILGPAYRFVSAGASYIHKFDSPERIYAGYLSLIFNELPHQKSISDAIRNLGPLRQDSETLEIMTLNYNSAVQATCRLLSQSPQIPERIFINAFGCAESLAPQNRLLEIYVAGSLGVGK